MRVTSRGFLTDLLFWRSFGRVEDRGDYLRVETPAQRTWYFGNLLLFERAPADGDLARWRASSRTRPKSNTRFSAGRSRASGPARSSLSSKRVSD